MSARRGSHTMERLPSARYPLHPPLKTADNLAIGDVAGVR